MPLSSESESDGLNNCAQLCHGGCCRWDGQVGWAHGKDSLYVHHLIWLKPAQESPQTNPHTLRSGLTMQKVSESVTRDLSAM